ncbi:MAG: GNAT family N-acetyltransferase [bacterium]|jgi:GNAT superfamily N-acetyltransferase
MLPTAQLNNTPPPTIMHPAPPAIRPVIRDDLPALKSIIDAVGLFPSAMLDDMLRPYLTAAPDCRHRWITDGHSEPSALAFFAPEPMTSGTWNVYLLAVDPRRQRTGRGTAMVSFIERTLARLGERIVLVETSGLPDFEPTRAFYRRIGYTEEARIRDFYRVGEDKVVFRKALQPAT